MLDEDDSTLKKKERNLQELEDLNFFLKSGTMLCKLAERIVPGSQIDVEKLEVSVSNIFTFYLLHLRLET